MQLLALMVCVFGITTGEFVIAGIVPAIAGDLGVSIPAAGMLVSAYAIGMIVGGPILTALTAQLPRKPLIVTLLIVAIVGNVVSAAAPTYAVLFIARVVTALVTSTFFANAIVIATSAAPPEKQASTVSKLVFGMNIAMIVGSPLGTFVGTRFGWRASFVVVAAICTVGLVLAAAAVRPAAAAPTSAVAELKVFRNRNVQLAILVTAVANAGLLMVFTYFAPLLTDLGGFTAGSVAGMLLIYGLGATVGNIIGGRLFDRHPVSSQLGLLLALAAGLAFMWSVARHPLPIGVMVFVIGALGFAVIPGMQARVLSTAGQAPTLAIAVNASAYQLAAAAAGVLGAAVIENVSLRAVYLAAAGVTVLGIAVSSLAWRHDRRTSPLHEAAADDAHTATRT